MVEVTEYCHIDPQWGRVPPTSRPCSEGDGEGDAQPNTNVI